MPSDICDACGKFFVDDDEPPDPQDRGSRTRRHRLPHRG
ncbi:MAG: hypothetical protein H6674_05270 [Dehalococcoidia bacterium]|nr:hypothetical protein [Dehalococcoidia bacterium]